MFPYRFLINISKFYQLSLIGMAQVLGCRVCLSLTVMRDLFLPACALPFLTAISVVLCMLRHLLYICIGDLGLVGASAGLRCGADVTC